jgi:hypothetical protein
MCHGAGLAQPIRLIDLDLQSFVNCVDQLFRQRSCSTRDHSQAAEIVLIHCRVSGQTHNNRRRHVYKCDLMLLDCLQKDLQVECRHHHKLNAPVQGLLDEPC